MTLVIADVERLAAEPLYRQSILPEVWLKFARSCQYRGVNGPDFRVER